MINESNIPIESLEILNEFYQNKVFPQLKIVILNEKNGKPYIRLIKNTKKIVEKKLKKKKYKTSLSLADEKNYAVAFVTIST